jgi:predicted  nucleic acid-binding Zn-ribbon protein
MKTTRDAAQQTQWLVDTEQVLEERERLAMQLEEARQGTKLAEDEVARLLTELSQSAKDIQQLYLHLYTSRNVENDIREENAALKEELKTVREAMPDVEQMQVELKKLRGPGTKCCFQQTRRMNC